MERWCCHQPENWRISSDLPSSVSTYSGRTRSSMQRWISELLILQILQILQISNNKCCDCNTALLILAAISKVMSLVVVFIFLVIRETVKVLHKKILWPIPNTFFLLRCKKKENVFWKSFNIHISLSIFNASCSYSFKT